MIVGCLTSSGKYFMHIQDERELEKSCLTDFHCSWFSSKHGKETSEINLIFAQFVENTHILLLKSIHKLLQCINLLAI